MTNNIFKLFLSVTLLGLSGCSSLPQQAPELSAEIGLQIMETKASHLALLNQFIIQKRSSVDDFITKVWIPEFAKNVFKKPSVSKEWDRVVESNNKTQRLIFITGLGTLLQKKINAKRIELMHPVDELEHHLVSHLYNHYDDMLTANSTLTLFLNSSLSIKERQNKTLQKLHINNINEKMLIADDIVAKIVSGKYSYTKNKNTIHLMLNKLKN